MKITKQQLKKIIREELEATMKETQVTGMRTPFHPPSDQSDIEGHSIEDPLGGPDIGSIGGPLETQLVHAIAEWGYERVKQMIDSMTEQGAAAKAADKEARGPGSVYKAAGYGKK